MTAQEHVHRARLYKLASLAFDRPIDDAAEAVASDEFDDQLLESAAALDDERLREAVEAVVAERPADEDEVDELYSDWARLFGFEQGGEIQQYEVEYRPGTLVTSTNVLADIAGFYGAFGLSVGEDNRERVDHLCIELEFCSHLALKAAYLEESGDETGVEITLDAHGDFLEDHLGRWLPRFRDTVHDECDVAFYRALAELAVALVDDDADRLDVDPDVFDETPPGPLEGLTNDDGTDFRCGTCGTMPSPESAEASANDGGGPG